MINDFRSWKGPGRDANNATSLPLIHAELMRGRGPRRQIPFILFAEDEVWMDGFAVSQAFLLDILKGMDMEWTARVAKGASSCCCRFR